MILLENYFYKYYIPVVEIKIFNVLIGNKPFFNKPVKNKQEAYEKLIENSNMVAMQEEFIRLFVSSKLS